MIDVNKESVANAAKTTEGFSEKTIKRFEEAVKIRDMYNDLFSDAYDYGFPSRSNFQFTNEGERRTDMIFDDTLINAIPEFASELQSGLAPINGDIARLVAGPSIPEEERFEIQKELDVITDFIHAKIRASNFADETHEALQDVSVSSLNMMMDAVGARGDLKFEAIPLHEVYMDCGPDGKPDGRYKLHRIKSVHLLQKWPNAELSNELKKLVKEEPNKKLDVIEGIYRDWEYKGDPKYIYFVIVKQFKETIYKKEMIGEGANPWITARWSANSGEVWGRGPVLNILPTVKSLNLVIQLIFENAQIAIGGIWQYDSDGTINPDNIFLEPGTFIPREIGSKIEPLNNPARFDVAQFVIEDARAAIRKGMMVDALDTQGKTPMSATQVGQEMGKFARRMGASYNRLWNEFIRQVFIRAIYIYKQRGLIELPKIDGETVDLMAVSPLARAQNANDITDFGRFLEVSTYALGPEMARLQLRENFVSEWLAEKIGLDKRILKTQAEKKEMIDKLKAEMEQNPEIMGVKGNGRQ